MDHGLLYRSPSFNVHTWWNLSLSHYCPTLNIYFSFVLNLKQNHKMTQVGKNENYIIIHGSSGGMSDMVIKECVPSNS